MNDRDSARVAGQPRWGTDGAWTVTRLCEARCRECGGINGLRLGDGGFEHRDPEVCLHIKLWGEDPYMVDD